MKKLFLTAAILVGLIGNANARSYHHRHAITRHHFRVHSMVEGLGVGLGHMLQSMGPKPRAWCGYYMRERLGVSDPAYNLAANWAHWGSNAGGPGIGVVVVWPHHVGRIVGTGSRGGWLVESGNDGHAVRTRERSVSGEIAFRRVG